MPFDPWNDAAFQDIYKHCFGTIRKPEMRESRQSQFDSWMKQLWEIRNLPEVNA